MKITNEPPRGLRANIGRVFADMTEEDFESCSRPREWKKLLFALVFYNGLILERKPVGAKNVALRQLTTTILFN